ncbi:MAG: hypothetical protein AAFX06_23175, partial [Planctomycetota bacterium]
MFKNQNDESSQLTSMPWDEKPSLYDHIRAHIPPAGPGLTEDGETLPDEERVNSGSRVRWAPGAMDGIATHHMAGGDSDGRVARTVDLVRTYCSKPTAKNKADLYRDIVKEKTVSLIDQVIEGITSHDDLNHQRLYELAHLFVTEATDREPTKFGIAILGLFVVAGNEDLFQTLGRHDDFTLFCAVALANSVQPPDQALWKLAKNVDGWGRIHVVERLSQTDDADIKAWLLRDGYRNNVMYEYLAYTCATAGGLLSAISTEQVDRELLTSAGEIIQALISGGPAECMDDYGDGALVTAKFLQHMEHQAEHVDDFLHVHTIQRYLTDDEADWGARAESGWNDALRVEMLHQCVAILDRPTWVPLVGKQLVSDEDKSFFAANQAADILGIPTWDHHWRRWNKQRSDAARWFQVVQGIDDERLPVVLRAATEWIDLKAIATGPSDELGFGPGFEHHTCLDHLLRELGRFPGEGEEFIEAGLSSPVVRNRKLAVAALSCWATDRRQG